MPHTLVSGSRGRSCQGPVPGDARSKGPRDAATSSSRTHSSSRISYAEKEQWEKLERAAMKWLRRYLADKEPTLKNFAKVVRSLEEPSFDGEGRRLGQT